MRSAIVAILLAVAAASVQAQMSTSAANGPQAGTAAEQPKRRIFRANKEQIKEVQKMLKARKLYSGDTTGKLDDATREAIRAYQRESGLNETGTLNRVTLEKMGITLTDAQKSIPVTTGSSTNAARGDGTRRYIFRATKDQITQAQKLLRSKEMYKGDLTGKLDDDTRAGLRKFQEASGIKVTGTLNQITLEKMGIELTERQKAAAAAQK